MTKTIKNIGVFTSGGDAPGMNASLYAIIKAASLKNITITGIWQGYDGMVDASFTHLHPKNLAPHVHQGGTIIKTSRSPRFLTLKGRIKAAKNLKKAKIDALIAIGGDGTFKGLMALKEICDIPTIGIPGTIDNDMMGTDYTLGFDSAVNTAINAIDNIRDTAESHNRIFLVEVMGRDSGYIAINSGLCTAADGILIPESKKDQVLLLNKLQHFKNRESLIIVVAEGDETGAIVMAEKIKAINKKVDVRITILGHIQRGGNPTAFDRLLGIRLGVAALDEVLKGTTNVMAGLLNNKITFTPFEKVVKQHKVQTELKELVELFSR